MAALIRPCFAACFMGARRWRAALGLCTPARVRSQQAPCGVFTCGRAAHHSRPRCRRAPRNPRARASRPPRGWPTRARCVRGRRRARSVGRGRGRASTGGAAHAFLAGAPLDEPGHTGLAAPPHQEDSLVVYSRARHVSLSYGNKHRSARHASHFLALRAVEAEPDPVGDRARHPPPASTFAGRRLSAAGGAERAARPAQAPSAMMSLPSRLRSGWAPPATRIIARPRSGAVVRLSGVSALKTG